MAQMQARTENCMCRRFDFMAIKKDQESARRRFSKPISASSVWRRHSRLSFRFDEQVFSVDVFSITRVVVHNPKRLWFPQPASVYNAPDEVVMGTTCFVLLFFVLPVNTASVFDVITIDDPSLDGSMNWDIGAD